MGESVYITSIEEIVWALLLLGVTIGIHAYGMLFVIRTDHILSRKGANLLRTYQSIGKSIVIGWVIILIHLLEVGVWAGFFYTKEIMPNLSLSFFVALMDYTTLGCNYAMPNHWRLLEGMIAIAGLLTFAWSTGVLFTIVDVFQKNHREHLRKV